MKTRIPIFLVALLIASFSYSTKTAYATHDDFVVLSTGSSGPAVQIFDLNGNLRAGFFVLNSTFTGVHVRQNVSAGPGSTHELILVCGTSSPAGPAFQLWDRNGSFLLGRFVFASTFTNTNCQNYDVNGDGIDEIVLTAQETGGAARGWAFQIFDQAGNMKSAGFILNSTFTGDLSICAGELPCK